MAAKGHVFEAISLYLRVSLSDLLGHIVRLGLAMPSMLPMRKTGGRRLWSIEEIHVLIELWSHNIHVNCIAAKIGRSSGAVRSKARRLGLYRRNRRDFIKLWTSAPKQPLAEGPLTRSVACADAGETAASAGLADELAVPANIEVVGSNSKSDVSAVPEHAILPSVELADAESDVVAVMVYAVPASIEVADAGKDVPAPSELVLLASVEVPDAEAYVPAATAKAAGEAKVKRRKAAKPAKVQRLPRVQWNDELDLEVRDRWLAGQCRFGIARDMGISEPAIRSRATLLGLPRRWDRKRIIADYVPGRCYDENLTRSMVWRRCALGNMSFYSTRNGPRTCPKVMKSKRYRELRSGLGEAHLSLVI
jgi:hypothetical protein